MTDDKQDLLLKGIIGIMLCSTLVIIIAANVVKRAIDRM